MKDRLDRVLEVARYEAAQGNMDDETTYLILTRYARIVDECVCNIGAQACAVHNRPTWSQEEKIAFRKAWDARVRSSE